MKYLTLILFGSLLAITVGCGKESNVEISDANAARKSKPSPTTITLVGVANLTQTGIIIVWKTSTPANSQVNYIGGGQNVTTPLVSTLSTSHSIQLTGLTAHTVYNVKLMDTDAGGTPASYNFAFSTQP